MRLFQWLWVPQDMCVKLWSPQSVKIRLSFQLKSIDIVLFLHDNICSGYSLEAPWQSTFPMSTARYIFVEKLENCYVATPFIWNYLWSTTLAQKYPITKTCLYNFDPLKPHFYTVKWGFTGVYIILLISAQKHRLWVLVRTASLWRF